MKFTKKMIATIALILTLTISATLVALPAATAQEYDPRKTTYALIGAMPNLVGVKQEVLIWLGISDYCSWPKPGWEGLTVEDTRPDGETEIIGTLRTNTTGSTVTVYTPSMVGTYYLQTHFHEHVLVFNVYLFGGPPILLAGTVMEASSSDIVELVVQEEPIEYHPGTPLPTE